LMTSSNFDDCIAGRSVSFAPLRMRPDISAALVKGSAEACCVAQQPAGFGKFTQRIGPPEGIARR
jgi:hypothetical protein